MRVYVYCVKRVLDFVIALIALCLLCPFLSFIALLLFIVHQSFNGIFFVQSRVGYKGRIFKILKFHGGTIRKKSLKCSLVGVIVKKKKRIDADVVKSDKSKQVKLNQLAH